MPSLSISIESWNDAVDRIAGKTVVASRLKSADWERVPLAIRERAFFSATMEQARALQEMKDDIRAMAAMEKIDGRTMDRSRIVERMRERLKALPGDSDSLTDVTSFRRQQLIVDFQVQDAYGHARWRSELSDPDGLDLEPAWEFVRIEARDNERQDWPQRWAAAYQEVGGVGALLSPMIALKTSPIWAALSRFRRPWEPFDFGSGMGRMGVGRDRCEELGLIGPLDVLDGPQAVADFNDKVKASLRGLDDETRDWLRDQFGDLAQFENDEVRMVTPPPEPAKTPDTPAPKRNLNDVRDRVLEAATNEEAHAALELPAAQKSSWKLENRPSAPVRDTYEKGADFVGRIVHRDLRTKQGLKAFIASDARCYYDPAKVAVYLRPGAIDIAAHEIMHHIEMKNPELLDAARGFLIRRARPGERARWLGELTGNRTYGRGEIAIEDDFVARGGSVYAGKVYHRDGEIGQARATEVFTMGIQRLYSDPKGFARQDPDYFDFIIRHLQKL